MSRRSALLGLASAGALAALSLAGLFVERRTRPRIARMPEAFGPLTPLGFLFPPTFGVRRVFLDPGHGAANNTGNVSCFCRDEQDFTLEAARELAQRLTATGHFQVKLARGEGERNGAPIEYRARLEAAEAFGAEVFLSLHSDIRGHSGESWRPFPDKECLVNLGAPGFSILWSDEGESNLVEHRHRLAKAIGKRMQQAGFFPYQGGEYAGLYGQDAEQAGVFVDRHAPEQRIFVLRRPKMPSALIETHHALDPREAKRWGEAHTHNIFASAIAASLVDALG